MLITNNC